MNNKVRIISDGTAVGTKVFVCDENGIDIEIDNIVMIEFMPLAPQGLLTVRLSLLAPQIDVIAGLSKEK